ncbi:hypothetical protein BU24DRAFT_52255 [Aaosphaeria arxii CBS 175.79]|uniref:Rhodopsin domain-containing protein n=1 Tax=Aaosphaeria arxii CBS 175.79 TaxID=1450172 RepID=A0A6A5XDH7_9PLEO|nr:uncharacterized protein BU24DRAFT_52255 [Aaosphaeria arxii CBS 175.79]KAF2011062.1 hypothetical protein BU24DRAFT_52255 [Aaosphaeria arxii CBS 175.79]
MLGKVCKMVSIDLSQPVLPPAAGIQSNFINPENEAALAYGAVISSIVLVTLFTWFRLSVKLWLVGSLHCEDYILPFAWIFGIANFTTSLLIYDFAPIIHSWDMQMHAFSKFLLLSRLSWTFYNISILLIKNAMLIQVLRIFVPRGTSSFTYYAIHAVLWTSTLYYTITAFLHIFTCNPIHKIWHPWVEGTCVNKEVMLLTTTVVNVVTDLFILYISQRVIWKTMGNRGPDRIKISLLFGAGLIPAVFSGICFYYMYLATTKVDFIYHASYMELACFGEIVGGMFVLFLAVLPSFFTHVRDTITQRSSSGANEDLEVADVTKTTNDRFQSWNESEDSVRRLTFPSSVFHVDFHPGSDEKGFWGKYYISTKRSSEENTPTTPTFFMSSCGC